MTFNKNTEHLDCRCRLSWYFCLHKALAIWYLYQRRVIKGNTSTKIDLSHDGGIQNGDEINSSETTSEKTPYPPYSEKSLDKMMIYWLACKQVPFPIPNDYLIYNKDLFPKVFYPNEVICQDCENLLSGPYKITSSARILTMQGYIDGIETFFRRCIDCNNFYRYQEYSDGVHNFDDILLLSLDVCCFLRSSQSNHLAVGTFCSIIENIWHFKVDGQAVLNAYMHFEALSKRVYNFNCVDCGYFPSVLIADLNRKVVFKYKETDDANKFLQNCDEVERDLVNCEDFWKTVTKAMLSRGFRNRKITSIDIQPNLLNWSPYIGPNSRNCNFLYNSESRKIHWETGEIEIDCRELSEERLIETMFESKLNDLRKLARKVGVSCKGRKLDIINRINDGLGSRNEKFNKVFQKFVGCSGGWLTVACPHGIIYAVKFLLRGESPRDYLDVLRSLKHKPNVFINDMAHIVAKHGNIHHGNFFKPHDGRVARPTPENIALALGNKLHISFPFLEKVGTKSNPVDIGCHPITGSDACLVLFDRFHESNTSSEVESLRPITCVKELRGKINSETVEQLHGFYNKNRHFLNQMKPINHIFLFRSIIDLANDAKNNKFIHEREVSTGLEVDFDECGRAIFACGPIQKPPIDQSDISIKTFDTSVYNFEDDPLHNIFAESEDFAKSALSGSYLEEAPAYSNFDDLSLDSLRVSDVENFPDIHPSIGAYDCDYLPDDLDSVSLYLSVSSSPNQTWRNWLLILPNLSVKL